ncbi:hypothetical protein D1B31_23755, partial [Neobacillus notoginsengisoli]
MTKADALSRRVDHAKGIESDNSGVTLIKPEWIRAQHVVVEAEEGQILDRIRSHSSDLDLGQNWTLEDGLYKRDGRIYVPGDATLFQDIITLHHDNPIAGHPGRSKTQELVQCNYWWPGLAIQVKEYVSCCDRCVCMKDSHNAPAG